MALLDDATNYFGPLDPKVRKRVVRFMKNPSFKTWDDIYTIIIRGDLGLGMTVWQAVIAVDPTFPRSGNPSRLGEKQTPEQKWLRFPDAMTVARAIKHALALPQKKRTR